MIDKIPTLELTRAVCERLITERDAYKKDCVDLTTKIDNLKEKIERLNAEIDMLKTHNRALAKARGEGEKQ